MHHCMQHGAWIRGGNFRTTAATGALAILLMVIALPAANGQTLTTLHSFSGPPDGALPTAGLAMDGVGNLYGTTQDGGSAGEGMVFKLVHSGSNWIEQPLYSFGSTQSGNDGAEPDGGVTIGPDGNLYGTTSAGGGAGLGTVFKLSPPASVCRSTLCPWTETILYRFRGGSDGAFPAGSVVFDSAGNLYGTTQGGGTSNCFGNNLCGVVFKLTQSESGWTETVLHVFSGPPDGIQPGNGLVFDQGGNLYGTTQYGGVDLYCDLDGFPDGCGTVFQLTPSGSGWTETIILDFSGGNGALPVGGLVSDRSGHLYGTTAYSLPGDGTVFELMPFGGQWTSALLYSLMSAQSGIQGPFGTLAMDAAGNLYGTTIHGGDVGGTCGYGCGTVFKLAPSGVSWTYSLLYEFTAGNDGAGPYAGVILDGNGNLYGTTLGAGAGGHGTVFEITP